MADRTYIEPLTVEVLKEIIARERAALLPTLGGHGSQLSMDLADSGVLSQFNGSNKFIWLNPTLNLLEPRLDAIKKAERSAVIQVSIG